MQPHTTAKETPVERIYREVTGKKMPVNIRKILLPEDKAIKPR